MASKGIVHVGKPPGRATALEPLDPQILRQLLIRVEELLPLPTVVNEILKVINDPYASLDRLAQVILSDQALTAKILKIINSAFYCLPVKVTTVSQAVPLLGVEKIKNLAMAISLSEGISRWPGLPGLSRESLWIHGQACAVATRLIAEQIGYPVSEEAMIAGMLHDVAKALWTELFPERFSLAMQEVRQGRLDPQQAETRYLSVPHATIGSWLLRQWSMPEVLQQAVGKHHDPVNSSRIRSRGARLPQCVMLGNLLAKLLNLGDGGNYQLHGFSPGLLRSLEVDSASLIALIQQLPLALQDFIDQLELTGLHGAHYATSWLTLKNRLAGSDLVTLTLPGTEEWPAPVSALCRALSDRVRTVPLKDFLATPPPAGSMTALVDISHPRLVPKLITLPLPKVPLLIICHSPHSLPRHSLPDHPWITCLGPEVNITEISSALEGKTP